MSQLTRLIIEKALSELMLPNGRRLSEDNLVSSIIIDEGNVGVIIDFGSNAPDWASEARQTIETTVKGIEGVTSANVIMTKTRPPSNKAQDSQTPKSPNLVKPVPTLRPAPVAPPKATPLPGVKHVITVASGKGGVGKSTTTINLAIALKNLGLSVGVLDADIFGPSLPTLVGCSEKPVTKDKIIQPIEAYGLKLMSIGFLIDVDQPVVWRGPRVMGATQQLLKDVAWGPLDVLLVDMPPGTGDVQLTMVQQAVLAGSIIVSTPQDLALIDAKKGLAMFNKVDVPIIGIIENMTNFVCPHCDGESHIFGHGGAEKTAQELKVPFLGGVPLEMELRQKSDAGEPLMATPSSESKSAKAYANIAKATLDFLEN